MELSVCMATYNGSLYVKSQVQSILKQLGSGDRLVIVDDASTDSTIDILRNLKDPRIEIYINNFNIYQIITITISTKDIESSFYLIFYKAIHRIFQIRKLYNYQLP